MRREDRPAGARRGFGATFGGDRRWVGSASNDALFYGPLVPKSLKDGQVLWRGAGRLAPRTDFLDGSAKLVA